MNVLSYFFPAVKPIPDWVRERARDDKWSISQERVFMEDLVYKRLTLFLTLTGALLAGAISLRDEPEVAVPLLFFGTILCWIIQKTIYRAQMKLDIILAILFEDATHPVGYIDMVFEDNARVRLVGYLVPRLICVLLSALTLFAAWVLLDQYIAS